VPETIPETTLVKSGAKETRDVFKEIPVATVSQLKDMHAIIVGSPTRFGSMAHQMRAFWDLTGKLWKEGDLVGKVGSAFTTTGTQHGGQETTITSMWTTFAHHVKELYSPFFFVNPITVSSSSSSFPLLGYGHRSHWVHQQGAL